MSRAGPFADPRPVPATVGDRALQALVVLALLLGAVLLYVRLLVWLLELAAGLLQ